MINLNSNWILVVGGWLLRFFPFRKGGDYGQVHCDHELEKQWQVKKGALNSIIEIITKVMAYFLSL